MTGNFNFNNKQLVQINIYSVSNSLRVILNVIYKINYFSEIFIMEFNCISSIYLIYINFLLSKISLIFFTKKFESFEKESILPCISFLTLFNRIVNLTNLSNHIAFDYPYNIFNYLSKIFLIFNHF